MVETNNGSVMGLGSYDGFIFPKSIALFKRFTLTYARQSIGVNPFRVSGVVLGFVLLLLVKLVKNSHTSPMTDPLFVPTFTNSGALFPHGKSCSLSIGAYLKQDPGLKLKAVSRTLEVFRCLSYFVSTTMY